MIDQNKWAPIPGSDSVASRTNRRYIIAIGVVGAFAVGILITLVVMACAWGLV